MPEPTSMTATATMVMAGATVPVISVLGLSLGIRADFVVAGFFGCLVSIILFDAVPGEEDTWRNLIKTSFRRMSAACASALTAGYLTPFFLHGLNLADPYMLGACFVIGWGAKAAIKEATAKLWPSKTGAPA